MNISRALRVFPRPVRLLAASAAAVTVFAVAGAGVANAAPPTINASPTQVVVPANQNIGTTQLSWNTGGNPQSQIYVSVDGTAEVREFPDAGPSGSKTMTLNVGHTYVYRFYVGPKDASPEDTVTVTVLHAVADLTVKYDGYINGAMRFSVKNQGVGPSGAFKVSVLAGADSYSFWANTLTTGASKQYAMPNALLGCNRSIAILVDSGHDVPETVENNNGTGFKAACLIDNGPILIGVDE